MSLLHAKSISVSIESHSVISNLDISINRGECWGILGANGVGKTTLLHVLAGLRKADAGEVCVDGHPISDFRRKELYKRVGILFQDSYDSFPTTVLESALTGRFPHLPYWAINSTEDIRLCMDALAEVSLSNMASREVCTLSGGERRRLALATLIIQHPKLWLLDEPTNHLDIHYQTSLLNLIVNKITTLSEGLLMSLHDVNLLVRFCSHALLMIDHETQIHGEISEVITIENLEILYQHSIRSVNDGGRILYYLA